MKHISKYLANTAMTIFWIKFNNVQEKEICRSLLCWINDGSHCVPDDFNIVQSDDITERYYEVFQKIFKVMGHIEHYNMMMEIESIG